MSNVRVARGVVLDPLLKVVADMYIAYMHCLRSIKTDG